MPEGPEVKNICTILDPVITGKHIVSFNVLRDNDKLNNDNIALFQEFLPLQITQVSCKGKLIFFQLLADDNTIFYLYSHLRMTGAWIFKEGSYSRCSLQLCNKICSRNCNLYVESEKLYFDNPRRWGVVEFLTKQEYQQKMRSIGPDLLSEDIAYQTYRQELINKRRTNMTLSRFLMKQEYFCGIGNYLKSEIMYRSALHPELTLGQLTKSEDDMQRLFAVARATIKEAYEANGLTIKNYKDPFGRKGIFSLYVYKKKFDPYGNEVIYTKNHGRGTYYVPTIQKLP